MRPSDEKAPRARKTGKKTTRPRAPRTKGADASSSGGGKGAAPKPRSPKRKGLKDGLSMLTRLRPVAWGLIALGAISLVWGGCGVYRLWSDYREAARLKEPWQTELLTTGYCNCEICCSWMKDAKGRPVYAYGKMKGKPKVIGLTSTGSTAHVGTIAADPKKFPFGTKIIVPGYGHGRVEDIGGAIKGDHIDLWFPSHKEALQWGKRVLTVTVIPN